MKKRLLAVLLALMTMLCVSVCSAEAIDVSTMDAQALLELREAVNARLRTLGAYPFVALKRGSKGEEVEALQNRLAVLGYYTKAIDGSYSTTTANAMKAFEKQSGLKQDGAASVDDQIALFADAAASKPTPTPSPTPRPTATPKRAHSYPAMDFKAIGLSPDKHMDERLSFTGYVVQVAEQGDVLRLRVSSEGETGNVVYLTAEKQAFTVAVGDHLSCCGMFKGLYTYQTADGQSVTLPQIEAEILEQIL